MQKFKFRWSRDLVLVAAAVFFLGFGFEGVYMTVYTNFVADDIGIKPGELGVIESIRESPGFLSAFLAALTMQISSPILGALALLIMSAGIGAFSHIYTFHSLIFWAVFWSVGFHCWAPLQPAMVLSFTKDEGKGKVLGQVSRIRDIAALLGMGLVAYLGKFNAESSRSIWAGFLGELDILRTLFVIAGSFVAIAAVVVFFVSHESANIKIPRLTMKKRYRFYYALTFLEGCRKQIFITFAIFVLIKEYGTNVSTIAWLMIINRIVTLVFAPLIGRLVDRIGERTSLSISNASLIAIFIGYAMVRDIRFLYVLYCLDSFVYVFVIAQTTYLNKIAPPEDVRPALSMGVTMNHTAAVIVPLIGGLLWEALKRYDVIFYGGSVVALISFIVSQFLWSDKAGRS